MYVELGRGQDYAWSATTSGQDIIDTYAVELCQDDYHYLYRGTCTAMEKIEQKNAWKPTTADGTAAGSYTMRVWRTKYGPVEYRATVGGKKVAYTSLRTSYLHEADSIIGFQMLNDPDYVKGPQDFQSAVQHINYTFNWFYADSAHTAYYNSGDNPVRASGVDAEFPVWARSAYEWRNWNPTTNTADYTPASAHPNSTDQDYYISWNNKQAKDYTTASWGDGSVHRGNLLDDRVRKLVTAGGVTRAALTKAMADAALADLRAEDVLPDRDVGRFEDVRQRRGDPHPRRVVAAAGEGRVRTGPRQRPVHRLHRRPAGRRGPVGRARSDRRARGQLLPVWLVELCRQGHPGGAR
jgi:hypothetical protein